MKRGCWPVGVGALLMLLPFAWSESPASSHQPDLESIAEASRASAAVPAMESDHPGTDSSFVQISFGPAVSKSRRLQGKLKSAYLTAVDRLRRDSRCRALFVPLEADGVEMLERSVYARADAGMEATWCRRAVAGTSVGKKMVFLCRRFASLPVYEAATILIHEALHRAGMSESPLDRGCMTGDEISEMVREACFVGDDAASLMVASLEQKKTPSRSPSMTEGPEPTVVKLARASSVVMPRTASRVIDIAEMRSSWPY